MVINEPRVEFSLDGHRSLCPETVLITADQESNARSAFRLPSCVDDVFPPLPASLPPSLAAAPPLPGSLPPELPTSLPPALPTSMPPPLPVEEEPEITSSSSSHDAKRGNDIPPVAYRIKGRISADVSLEIHHALDCGLMILVRFSLPRRFDSVTNGQSAASYSRD